jgi:hypothetical protein
MGRLSLTQLTGFEEHAYFHNVFGFGPHLLQPHSTIA